MLLRSIALKSSLHMDGLIKYLLRVHICASQCNMNILPEEQYSCIILAITVAGKSYKKKHAYHADLAEIVGKLIAGKRDSGVIILANRSISPPK